MIESLFPILEVVDVQRALRFWRDLMGGTVAFEWPGPDGQPVYVGVDIGRSHLGIGGPTERAIPTAAAISLWVYTEDCDGLVERLRAADVTITAEPTDQPWGERVARVIDPDGNVVIIGQRVATLGDAASGAGDG